MGKSLWLIAVGFAASLAIAQDAAAPRAATSPSSEPASQQAAASEDSQPARQPPRAREPAGGSRSSRIELDTTRITGNRELPRVLHIVPWKRADLDELGGKPVGSLLDEVLAPVDRDVFRRESRYYRALQPDEPSAAPAAEPGN